MHVWISCIISTILYSIIKKVGIRPKKYVEQTQINQKNDR